MYTKLSYENNYLRTRMLAFPEAPNQQIIILNILISYALVKASQIFPPSTL